MSTTQTSLGAQPVVKLHRGEREMSVGRFRKAVASATPLQDGLDIVRADWESRILSKDVVRIMHRVRDQLVSAHSVPALGVGSRAPEFELPDYDGEKIASRALLRKGPLVTTFYRGSWCPYCAYDLEALQATFSELEVRGASVVAVSQETASRSRRCRTVVELGFPLLRDQGGEVAARYGVRWTVPADLQRIYRILDADLDELNGEDSWTLSMPARFVIDLDGIIAYAVTSPDYTVRSEPRDLVSVLDMLRRRSAN